MKDLNKIRGTYWAQQWSECLGRVKLSLLDQYQYQYESDFLHPPVTFSVLGSNFLLRTLFTSNRSSVLLTVAVCRGSCRTYYYHEAGLDLRVEQWSVR